MKPQRRRRTTVVTCIHFMASIGKTESGLLVSREEQAGELEAVLAAPAFAHGANISRILRYVCEKPCRPPAHRLLFFLSCLIFRTEAIGARNCPLPPGGALAV
jgi:hypothetical protein